jgi:hypothetical protein
MSDLVQRGLVTLLVDQVDQALPVLLVELLELTDVLLLLPLWAYGDGKHIGRLEATEVELDAAGDKRLVEGARSSP